MLLPLPLFPILTPPLRPPREKTCPCCRKEVKRKKMVHMNKLRKTIGRLEVKVAQSTTATKLLTPLGGGQSQERGQGESHLQRELKVPEATQTADLGSSHLAELCHLYHLLV